MRPRKGRAQPRSLADWLAALAASGWKGRKVGRQHEGPCPLCGGEDRFHVAEGSRVAVIAGCRHGCTFEALSEAVHGPVERRRGPRRLDWTRNRPKPVRGPENGSQAVSGRSGGIRAGSEAVESPVRRPGDLPRGRGRVESGPKLKDHAPPVNTARRLWERSEAVPMDPAHPARRWAATKEQHPLWPDADPWPEAVRWIGRDGGSLVCAFAPVADWTEHPPATPSGVQCVHVDPEGRPRKDRGGLAKRSHGSTGGAVCVVAAGDGPVHVVEGLADALAVAAREDGTVFMAGGCRGWPKLAASLAALARPVVLWPDGDTARNPARKLARELAARGAVVRIASVPDGEDPASMAQPFTASQPARNVKPGGNRGRGIACNGRTRGDPTHDTPANRADSAPDPCAVRQAAMPLTDVRATD